MSSAPDFIHALESKVKTQLRAQRVGYLLGAGSSHLNNAGYPLAGQLWDLIKGNITDMQKRADIQAQLDGGASGLEDALDRLDDGGARDTPYRYLVTDAIAAFFLLKNPDLDLHVAFVQRLSTRASPAVKLFSLNYDPLIERAADAARVRLSDGFIGVEHAHFDPAVFEERTGLIRGTYKGRQFDETVKPLHLLKLHGSLGWYECPTQGARRCAYGSALPRTAQRLMIPPQRRKATDTMRPPFAALWSIFRGYLSQGATPLNRLACFGYGFADEHVNAVIEAAMPRTDFTLLIFTKELSDPAWERWSAMQNAVVVTSTRCSLNGSVGPGHNDLWRFERLCREV